MISEGVDVQKKKIPLYNIKDAHCVYQAKSIAQKSIAHV
jgi:hypothetical protein